jgi:hypothetical protein
MTFLAGNLFKLADILKKSSLQIEQRVDIDFLPIGIKTHKFRPFRMFFVPPFKEIKGLKKVVLYGDAPVTCGLRRIKPEANGFDPIMDTPV